MTKTGQLRDLSVRHQQLLRLVELSVTLNSTLDLDALLQLITATATELLDCEAASILLYDEKNPRLYFAAATGSDPAKLAEIPVPMEGSLAGTIFRTNQPIILNNAEQDPRHYSLVSDHIKFKIDTLLGVPMPIKDRTVGVLEAVNKHDGVFTDSDVAILTVTAAHAAIAINNARLLSATRQALEKVKETNQIKSHFLSLASHELRTPLGIIIGYATFLQEEAKGELSDHAQQVLNAAAQMRSLLDQMNNLTLLQADEMEMRPMKISIQDILNFACDEIKYFQHDGIWAWSMLLKMTRSTSMWTPKKQRWHSSTCSTMRHVSRLKEVRSSSARSNKATRSWRGCRTMASASPLINCRRYSKSSIRSSHRTHVVMADLELDSPSQKD